MIIQRHTHDLNIFKYDKRKEKKLTEAAILLIEYFTEESNGFMTAEQIALKLRSVLGLRIHAKTVASYRHTYLSNFLHKFLFKLTDLVGLAFLFRKSHILLFIGTLWGWGGGGTQVIR